MADGNVVFTDLSVNSYTMKWDFGDGKSVEGNAIGQAIGDETVGSMLQPTHNYIAYGVFNAVLTTTSNFGCEDSYEKTIIVEEDQRVYVPNSFTPDGDGINDVFKVEGSTVQEKDFSLTIYNRGGNIVFQSFDLNLGWDGLEKNGREAQPQVYVFMIRYYSGDKPYEKNGTVTLLR
jgi:gliding motility-associated-like protein